MGDEQREEQIQPAVMLEDAGAMFLLSRFSVSNILLDMLSFSLSLFLTLTHSLTHTLSLSFSHSLSHTHTLSLFLSFSVSLSLPLSLPPSPNNLSVSMSYLSGTRGRSQ